MAVSRTRTGTSPALHPVPMAATIPDRWNTGYIYIMGRQNGPDSESVTVRKACVESL